MRSHFQDLISASIKGGRLISALVNAQRFATDDPSAAAKVLRIDVRLHAAASVHLVMIANVDRDDFGFRDQQFKRDAVAEIDRHAVQA